MLASEAFVQQQISASYRRSPICKPLAATL